MSKFKRRLEQKLNREDIIKAFEDERIWYLSEQFTFLELMYLCYAKTKEFIVTTWNKAKEKTNDETLRS